MSQLWIVHVTHAHGSCHTYEWVMSNVWIIRVTHVHKSCHTYESFMPHMCIRNVTHMNESCHTYESFMSQMCMSQVTHMNASCHTYESFMPHMCKRKVTHMKESCHTYESFMPHMCMSQVTHMNESCHTYESVRSHVWIIQVTHVHKSCHTCEWVMSHMWMSHVTHVHEWCHTCEWVMGPVESPEHTWHYWRRDSLPSLNAGATNWNWRLIESCHTCGWVMSQMWMRPVSPRVHTHLVTHDISLMTRLTSHVMDWNRQRLLTPDWVISHMCIHTCDMPHSHTYIHTKTWFFKTRRLVQGSWAIHFVCVMVISRFSQPVYDMYLHVHVYICVWSQVRGLFTHLCTGNFVV